MVEPLYFKHKVWYGPKQPRPRIEVPSRIIYVHHSVTAPKVHQATSPEDRLHARNVHDVGTHNTYNGAYNFLILPSGRAFEFAGWGFEGAHTFGHNDDGHGICFAGNFVNQKPTDKALETFLRLVRQGVRRGAVKNTEKNPVILIPHRAVGAGGFGPGSTECPGTHLIEKLPYLQRELKRDRR